MPWTPEEHADWLARFREQHRRLNREIDRTDAPLFAAQWSAWQAEEQRIAELDEVLDHARQRADDLSDEIPGLFRGKTGGDG